MCYFVSYMHYLCANWTDHAALHVPCLWAPPNAPSTYVYIVKRVPGLVCRQCGAYLVKDSSGLVVHVKSKYQLR